MSRAAIDLAGKRFGGLHVLGRLPVKAKHAQWRVKCEGCGSEFTRRGGYLRRGFAGCDNEKCADRARSGPRDCRRLDPGARIGQLTVVGPGAVHGVVECRCDCGAVVGKKRTVLYAANHRIASGKPYPLSCRACTQRRREERRHPPAPCSWCGRLIERCAGAHGLGLSGVAGTRTSDRPECAACNRLALRNGREPDGRPVRKNKAHSTPAAQPATKQPPKTWEVTMKALPRLTGLDLIGTDGRLLAFLPSGTKPDVLVALVGALNGSVSEVRAH